MSPGAGEDRAIYKCCDGCCTPDSCEKSREGLGCGRCQQGKHPTLVGGECAQCIYFTTDYPKLVVLALLPLGAVATLLIRTARQDATWTAPTPLVTRTAVRKRVAVHVAQVLRYLQLQRVLTGMQITWAMAESSALGVFELDFGSVGLLACRIDGSFKSRIVARWSVVWAVVASILGGFAVASAFARWSGRDQPTGRQLAQLAGRAYVLLAVSIAQVASVMFHCLRNPTGERTLNAFRDVDCASEEYEGMVPAGAFHVVAFVGLPIAWLATALWTLPARSLVDPEDVQKHAFLFSKYRHAAFYWTFVSLVVNALLTWVPALAHDGFVQAMGLMGLTIAYCFVVAITLPYATRRENWTELLVYGATWLQIAVALGCGFAESPRATVVFVEGEEAARETWILAAVFVGRSSMTLVLLLCLPLLCRRGQPARRAERALATVTALEPQQRLEALEHLAPIERAALAWGLGEVQALTSAQPTFASGSALVASTLAAHLPHAAGRGGHEWWARRAFRVWEPAIEPVIEVQSDSSAADSLDGSAWPEEQFGESTEVEGPREPERSPRRSRGSVVLAV